MVENESNVQDNSPEWYRETGKMLLKSNDPAERSDGVGRILKALSMDDAEAAYIVGELILLGELRPKKGDPEEHALALLSKAALCGEPRARALLNSYCESRYEKKAGGEGNAADRSGPIVDFDGEPIVIDRKGVFTPIDAELKYEDGVNSFILSANILFLYGDEQEVSDQRSFEEAVLKGIRDWEGEYRVFNDQALRVVMNITTEPRLFDNVIVMPLTGTMRTQFERVANAVGTENMKKQANSIISDRRSFAASGFKWSVRSRKLICIQSKNGKFDDYEEIRHVAKHEFGHALGLGDLYESKIDQLSGVDKGTFYELDGYYLANKFYNLVMCDHHGPISNNDVEMVLLAFRENRAQLYQSDGKKGRISKALGRGN